MKVVSAVFLFALGLGAASKAQAEDAVRDDRFNNGKFYVDAFGGGLAQIQRGQRILRLPDGDVVVAAVVPRPDGAADTVGLVRYGLDGVPANWVEPSHPYSAGKSYVIYERKDKPYEVRYVRDMKFWDGKLYLLVSADREPLVPPAAPEPFEVVEEVYVLVFDASGKFLKENRIRAASADPLAPRMFAAGGIALYVPDLTATPTDLHLVYAGGAYGVDTRAEFARYAVDADGGLVEIVSPRAINPGKRCDNFQACEFRAVTLGGRPSPCQPPRIYLGGLHRPVGATSDFLAVRVNADGIPAPDFGTGGGVTVGFPSTGVGDDVGRLLAATSIEGKENRDTLYQSGEISGSCALGAGLVKFRANGSVDPSFGVGGQVRWYAPDAVAPVGGACPPHGNGIRLRGGMVIDNDRIVLAALRERGVDVPSPGWVVSDALLTAVDRHSGALVTNVFARYEADLRTHDSGFTDLISWEKGAYLATGTIRVPFWAPTPWTSLVATVGLRVN